MSMHNAIDNVSGNLTNGVIYSTSQTNVVKSQLKRAVYPSKKKELYLNQSGLFSSAKRVMSNELDQNFYPKTDFRLTSISHETKNTVETKNDSFFDMLQDYHPAVLGVIGTSQRSPGPAEFMQNKEKQPHHIHPSNKYCHDYTNQQTISSSSNIKITRDLKVKNKIHRFLIHPKPKSDVNGLLGLSILTKNFSINEDVKTQSHSVTAKKTCLSPEEFEEQQRQRTFGHYDCQSLAVNMNYAKTNKKMSTSNISPSATISKSLRSISTELNKTAQDSYHGNELLECCTNFCNEIGGENNGPFRSKKSNNIKNNFIPPPTRRPIIPCSVSVLESFPNETLWQLGVCPFQNYSCAIESVDNGAHYYKRYFYNQIHENWFGIDENLGPIAISIKKEKIHEGCNDHDHQFRIIIRTSELLTLRGLVIEDCMINSRLSGKSVTSKELIEYIAPDIQLSCLRMGVSSSNSEQQLLKLDEQGLQSKYKVGILYCRSGQSTEEDMYNNEHAGPAFTEFLDIIGKRVRLKGFQQYKAGLDNKSDSTGKHSVYAFYKNCEVMFHVCTMLPFTPNNRQQLLRKRHIGNDIVTIIFQEPGALPFDPNNIRSQFQHVFLIVRSLNPCSNNTTYRVAITRSKEVPIFGPPLPASALFSRNKIFAEFILAKIINAENAAHCSDKFANLAIRTRREYLKDLYINYCTSTTIDPVNKFSIFTNRKKEKIKFRFSGDLSQRGAICWRILLQDYGLGMETECIVGISIETFVIIEKSSKTVIFAMPTRSILGWTTRDNSFKIFYHNGECITFNMFYLANEYEQLQIVERLEAVTLGNGALELNMRRNIMGQLGFHVQPDGIVTQVDITGQACVAGLRRSYRLVEVCKTVVATLSYAELIELLKKSAQMNAIVIKSVSDGTPRLGCFNKNCKVNLLSQEFSHSSSNRFLLEKDDYGAKSFSGRDADPHTLVNYKTGGSYEQRSLPHKSKNSSSYNTGSSCFSSSSLGDEYKKALQQSNSSSSHSFQNDNWYDILDDREKSKTAFALNHHYTLKSLEHSLRFEESSDLAMHSNTSSLINSDRSRVQIDTFNSQILQNQGPECEVTGFKSVISSQNDNYNFNKGAFTRHSEFSENNQIIESKSGPTHINTINKLTAIHPTSTVKVGVGLNNFNPSMNSIQQRTSNFSKGNRLRPDLLEIIRPNCFSFCDSLKANFIPVVEKDRKLYMLDNNTSSPITNILKNPEKTQAYDSSDVNVKKHQQNHSGSSSRYRRGSGQDRNTISTAPLLLPYSKELDWTTLVDTATQAIILQNRDDNRNSNLCSLEINEVCVSFRKSIEEEIAIHKQWAHSLI